MITKHTQSQTLFLLYFILVFLFFNGIFSKTCWAEKISQDTRQKLKGLTIPFIKNQGQVDPRVKFYARTFSGTVYITDQGKLVYQLPESKDTNQTWVLSEEALDRIPLKEIKGEKASETQVSYYIGNDQAKWKKGLSTYEAVDLGEVYEGIALKLRAYGGKVEKLYYVSPGNDPKKIRMKINGAESLKINNKGQLEVQTGNGPVVLSRPKAFQQEGEKQKKVTVAYLIEGDRYGFKVGNYDKSRELIIDPMIQSTYLGGNGEDIPYSMAVVEGAMYIAGSTTSTNFPGSSAGAQPIPAGAHDAFVSLISTDLKSLIQTTYLGGTGDDYAYTMAVSGGNVYVAGETGSADFPATSGGAQPIYKGHDAFVSCFSADLKNIFQSTYLAGGSTRAWAIAVSQGNVYVAGETWSNDFPGTSGGAQPTPGSTQYSDGFLSLLSGDLKQIIQSTYIGGNSGDIAYALDVSQGTVYVTGITWSSNFPAVSGGAQPVIGGIFADGFVSLVSADLKQFIQSTFLGGTGTDIAKSLIVSGEKVYIVGYTESRNFPGTSGGAQPAHAGGVCYDAFVSILSSDLKQLFQSTYLGGTGNDLGYSISLSGGNIYISGSTSSTTFPATGGGVQPVFSGMGDAFVSILGPDLKSILQSTYIGGSSCEPISLIVVSSGIVYIVGQTESTTFPGTEGGAQPIYGGGSYDVFISLLSGDLKAQSPPYALTGEATKKIANSATLNAAINPYGLSTTYYFQYGLTTSYGNETPVQTAGNGVMTVPVSINVNGLTPLTTYHFRLVAINSAGTSYGSDMIFKTIVPLPWVMLLLGD
jgi:hypothetical protein